MEERQRRTEEFIEEVKRLPHKNTLLNPDQGFLCHEGEC